MANIEDYLRWRGDLSFAESPFNEIDSLILTQICYLNLQGIVPSWNEKKSVSMAALIENYWKRNIPAEMGKRAPILKNPSRMLELLKESRRYADLLFANYQNQIEEETSLQFSAMTVAIPDGSIYVAYCGTDITMIGWRESLSMCYLSQVPAQLQAVRYLERIYDWSYRKIRLGGHSKGGNLAVYAAIYISPEIGERIYAVDNFDGPGFHREITESEAYKSVLDKVKTYLPESSIIGRLLEHSERFMVIHSDAAGIWQHDAFSWQVQGDGFVAAKLDLDSDRMEETLDLWLNRMEIAERQRVVDSLFELLDKADIKTVEDFNDMNWKKVLALLRSFQNLDKHQKQGLKKALTVFWTEGKKVWNRES